MRNQSSIPLKKPGAEVAVKNKLFLSFHSELKKAPHHRAFAQRVAYYLRLQAGLDVFCYDRGWNEKTWPKYVTPFIKAANEFILFAGDTVGKGQLQELVAFCVSPAASKRVVIVKLRETLPKAYGKVIRENNTSSTIVTIPKWRKPDQLLGHAMKCASDIFGLCCDGGKFWDDGLPVGYPFDYEKNIIDHFLLGSVAYSSKPDSGSLLMDGCPLSWPRLDDCINQSGFYLSPLGEDEVGESREDKFVVVDPRGLNSKTVGKKGRLQKQSNLVFLEAGPRKRLTLPEKDRNVLTIGIAVSGGIAPGINSVIEGIVERHISYYKASKNTNKTPFLIKEKHCFKRSRYDLVIKLFRNGLSGILEEGKPGYNNKAISSTCYDSRIKNKIEELEVLVREGASKGGSQIETFRFDELLPSKGDRNVNLDRMVDRLIDQKIDILYIIGGEGSMRAAHALQTRAKLRYDKVGRTPRIVGIPKTMDNDILWVWQSFGFLSAVEKAREFIVNLHTEVSANPRLCVIQLFGSDSGFVVSHAALGAGAACCGALIPEVNFSLDRLGAYICSHLKKGTSGRHGGLVLAETAIPVDVEDHLDKPSLGVSLEERSAVRAFMGSALLTKDDIVGDGRIKLLCAILRDDGNIEPKVDEKEKELIRNCIGSKTLSLMRWLVLEKRDGKVVDNCWPLILDALNEVIRSEHLWTTLENNVRFHIKPGPLYQRGPALLNTLKMLKPPLKEKMWKSKNLAETLKDLTELMGLPYEALLIFRLIDPTSKHKHYIPEKGKFYMLKQLRKRLTEVLNRTIIETIFDESLIRRLPSVQSERRVFGQTPDELRMAGLKIVSNYLQSRIRVIESNRNSKKSWEHYRVLINQPRHLIRSMDPSCHDVIFCGRLGKLAVDNAMGGYRGFMISQWLTEYVLVPLDLVVLGRKRVPPYGIFWKSVIASTEQPANLWWPEPSKVERAGGDSSSSKQAHP